MHIPVSEATSNLWGLAWVLFATPSQQVSQSLHVLICFTNFIALLHDLGKRMLDRRWPIDYRVAPLVADPAGIFNVLPSWVHLPLSTSWDVVLMSKPPLELKLILFFDLWVKTRATCCVFNDPLFLKDLFQLDTLKCCVLSWACVVHRLKHILTFLLRLAVLMIPTVNSLLQVVTWLLLYSRISCEMYCHQTLGSS